MPRVIGCVVIEAGFKARSKEGAEKPWEIWHFKVNKFNKNLSVFISKKKRPKPFKGMKIDLLEYEEKQDGEYTNYQVDEIKVADDSPSAPSEGSPPTSTGSAGQRPKTGTCRDDPRWFNGGWAQTTLMTWLQANDYFTKLKLDHIAALHGYLTDRYLYYNQNPQSAIDAVKSLTSIIGGHDDNKPTTKDLDPIKDPIAFIAECERLRKALGSSFDEILKGVGYDKIEDVPDQVEGRRTILDLFWQLEKSIKSSELSGDPVG